MIEIDYYLYQYKLEEQMRVQEWADIMINALRVDFEEQLDKVFESIFYE